jgi:hypothetical protein
MMTTTGDDDDKAARTTPSQSAEWEFHSWSRLPSGVQVPSGGQVPSHWTIYPPYLTSGSLVGVGGDLSSAVSGFSGVVAGTAVSGGSAMSDDETAAQEIDNILARLDRGIAREQDAMDALLSRLRTTLIAA